MAKLDPTMILPVGLYVLTQNVINPAGDRRCKLQFWRRTVWKKGQKFVVEKWQPDIDSDMYALRPVGGSHILGFNTTDEANLRLVLPHLEMVPLDTFEAVIMIARESGLGPERILQRLVEQGKVTLDDIKAFLQVR